MNFNCFSALGERDFYIKKIDVYNGFPNPPDYTVLGRNEKKFSRFFYVVSGIIVFNENTNKTLRATAGDLLYLPADITYTSYWVEGLKAEYIAFNCNIFDTDNNEILLADDILLLCRDRNNKFYDIFQKMHEVYYLGASNWELVLKSHFYSFLADLIYQFSYDELKNYSLSSVIYNGIVELENNYMINVPISELARKCAVSETTFRRNFTKLKGMSPVSYRNDLRLKHAYNFLMSGLYSVTEVVEMVGFNELPYFSRSFKKKFGITPVECIKKIKNPYGI